MLLENESIKLRALEPEDLEVLYEWENDTRLWIHGNTLSPYSKLALRQYISETQMQDIYQAKQLRLMIILKSENKTIGAIDLYDLDFHNRRAGTGILIEENYRNQNYATQTLELIKEYAFSFLRLKQLYAYILVENLSSIKIFKRAGFSQCGIMKQWTYAENEFKDTAVFQLLNNAENE